MAAGADGAAPGRRKGGSGADTYIGTSGWHYRHWVGPFYPEDMKPRGFLDYYSTRFRAVEINATFYRLPSLETLEAWRTSSPPDMVFACKASRYITHARKLTDPEGSFSRFFKTVEALGDKAGPVLFQLPPRWKVNVARLSAFLEMLPEGRRYAFEFRDESWFCSAVYEALARHDAAFCLYDIAGRRSPIELTADFTYVRLHGPGGAYQGSYDGRTLSGWARRFRAWRGAGRDVFCFFDNDDSGYAPRNALRMQDMVARA
jgi:uncharacterized protein YecE (DUF72 family)